MPVEIWTFASSICCFVARHKVISVENRFAFSDLHTIFSSQELSKGLKYSPHALAMNLSTSFGVTNRAATSFAFSQTIGSRIPVLLPANSRPHPRGTVTFSHHWTSPFAHLRIL